MLEDLRSGREMGRLTDRLLRAAGAYDRFPTPVSDIVAAAELSEPEQSLLADQVFANAPRHIREAVAPFRRKIRALLDRKAREIHLDPAIDHDGQRAFKRLHEVTHDICPWQQQLAHADDDLTLSWATHALFEREANQGAAELLFQRDRFRDAAADYAIGTAPIVELAERFGSSLHAAFRRYVETHRAPLAGLVLEVSPCSRDPLSFRRKEAPQSPTWTARFGLPSSWPTTLTSPPYDFLSLAERAPLSFRPPRAAFPWPNSDLEKTINAEVMSNTYRLFVLLWVPQRELLKRKRVLHVVGVGG
jgi:hypothetical protein